MKKPYLYLLPYPLPPIRLVVAVVFQEREFQKLVVAVVLGVLDVSRPRPCEHSCHLERFDVARLVIGAIAVVPTTPVHVAAPHAIVHSLDAVAQFLVGLASHVHILDVPALAFPSPEGRR